MKKIATIAAIAALTTLAACGTEEAPAEAVATEAVATEAVATEAANAVDPNLQQVCDSQTPTAACDAVEAAPAADSK